MRIGWRIRPLPRPWGIFWRAKAKAGDGQIYGRIINTSSEAGLSGPVGQPNYGAAKAGITALTLSAARALGRFGVRANAIAPRARTAMTAGAAAGQSAKSNESAGTGALKRSVFVRALVEGVSKRHGRIDGIVHGAGVIEDKLLADKNTRIDTLHSGQGVWGIVIGVLVVVLIVLLILHFTDRRVVVQ